MTLAEKPRSSRTIWKQSHNSKELILNISFGIEQKANDHTLPTANGSGFIDELAWLT